MNRNSEIIGVSTATEGLRDTVKHLSRSRKNILLVGEPGVGKSYVALSIHRESKLAEGRPFVSINARAGDGELKAVLFGEGMKEQEQLGKSIPELVPGTTLLIEETEEMSFLNQARVAKFLQDQENKNTIRIALTLRDEPDRLLLEQKLSETLMPYLADFERVFVPPLRERAEDIPYFVKFFVGRTCKELGTAEKIIDANTLDFLTKQIWKENLRELKSVIDNAVVASQGDVLTLPESILNEHMQLETMISNIKVKKRFFLDKSMETIEKLLVQRALNHFGFNQSKVSEVLGVSEPTLRYKMKKLGIPPARKR